MNIYITNYSMLEAYVKSYHNNIKLRYVCSGLDDMQEFTFINKQFTIC
jgi:hypothetical protein